MNGVAVRALVAKDLATIFRNNGIRIPLLVAPLVLLVFLPVVLVLGGEALAADVPLSDLGGITTFDQSTVQDVTGATGEGGWAVFVLEVFLAPMFLLVPLITATVIAADSFAGERERGTLEALLHTPTTDRELLAAKFLASWLPATTVATISFVVYSVLANVLAWPTLGRVFFPTPTWLLLALWVAPGLAAFGLGVMTVVSGRVETLQAAHQVGSLLVLPIVLLLIAQVSGQVLIGPGSAFAMGAAVWAGAGLFLLTAGRRLQRSTLALRL